MADRHVYLPIYGFGSSLNLSVATALITQRLLDLCPEAIGAVFDCYEIKLIFFLYIYVKGDTTLEERAMLRREWFAKMTERSSENQVFLFVSVEITANKFIKFNCFVCVDSKKLLKFWLQCRKGLFLYWSNFYFYFSSVFFFFFLFCQKMHCCYVK